MTHISELLEVCSEGMVSPRNIGRLPQVALTHRLAVLVVGETEKPLPALGRDARPERRTLNECDGDGRPTAVLVAFDRKQKQSQPKKASYGKPAVAIKPEQCN